MKNEINIEMKNEMKNEMETKTILEIFELFKTDSHYHYKIEANAPIIFGDETCELSLLVGYEKTIHYITIPTSLFLRYGNEILDEDGIYLDAKYGRVMGSNRFDEDQADEIMSEYGSGYYYTQMGLSYDERFEMSEYIVDRLIGDLFNEYKTGL